MLLCVHGIIIISLYCTSTLLLRKVNKKLKKNFCGNDVKKFYIRKKTQSTADYRITDCLDFINVSKCHIIQKVRLKKSVLMLQNSVQLSNLSRHRYFWYVSLFWQAEQLLKLSTSDEVKLGWHIHTTSSYCLIIVRHSINSVSIHRTRMRSYCLPVPQVFLNMTVIVWVTQNLYFCQ